MFQQRAERGQLQCVESAQTMLPGVVGQQLACALQHAWRQPDCPPLVHLLVQRVQKHGDEDKPGRGRPLTVWALTDKARKRIKRQRAKAQTA